MQRALSLLVLVTACSGPPAGGDCRTEGCAPPLVCVEAMGGAECACPPGTRPEGGECAPLTTCTEDACRMRGTCVEEEGGVRCECEPEYAGVECERCAAGLFDDGMGGCSSDPCAGVECEGDRACVVRSGSAVCECPAGTHEDGGVCVPDTECTPTTCNGHGACEAPEGTIACTCEEGWSGARCEACDASEGYHDDGAGGCTTDVCLPNPCADPHRGICGEDALGRAECSCDAGYHLDLDACVADEVCEAATCSGHGACDVVDGRTRCECDDGFAGASCDACDEAAGYHEDGAGGCTTDVCVPSPCTTPGRSVCTDLGGTARCDCDPGLHEDGVGGCTADPCVPDPCAASGQACRDAGGTAECYTPVCDDGNPCTTDSVVGGACRYDPLPDGTSCSTSICRTGEQCAGGSCGGGERRRLRRREPLHRRSLRGAHRLRLHGERRARPRRRRRLHGRHLLGLRRLACSERRALLGRRVVQRRRALHAGSLRRGRARLRDDERAGAARAGRPVLELGLRRADRSLRAQRSPRGSSCDDTIACTSGDACRSGTCRGTPTAACGSTTCTGTTTLTTLDVELSAAHVSGSLVYAGSSTFPGSSASNTISVYLRSRATGVHHLLERVAFGGWTGTHYPVSSFNETDDRVLDLSVLPGVYDVVYYRNAGSEYVSRSSNSDPYPFAQHVLVADLVIGPGENTLTLDLGAARVTGALLHAGSGTFPGSSASNTISLYLRSRSTGAHHLLERVAFGGWTGTHYPVSSFNETDDRDIDLAVLPGAYDVVYYRNAGSEYVSRSSNADPTPSRSTSCARTWSSAPGPPRWTSTSGPPASPARCCTRARAPSPGSSASNTISLYLRSRSTGTHHLLERVAFGGWTGTEYPVSSFNETDDRDIDLAVLPGAYDVVYYRNAGSSYVSRTSNGDPYPFAQHVLRENVVIGPGATSLSVDVAASRVTGSLLHAGSGTFPGSSASNTISVYLRSRSTGAHHLLERVAFGGWTGTHYPVSSFNETDDRAVDLMVLPGAYDVVYYRNAGSDYVSRTSNGDPYPFAQHVIREDVAIGPGATSLSLELAATRVTGSIVHAGSSTFPGSSASNTIAVYLRSRSTGAHHLLERVAFGGWTGTHYPVSSFNEADDRSVDLAVLPGTYDVVYYRNAGSEFVSRTSNGDPYPFAQHVIREGLVVGSSPTSVTLDVGASAASGALLYGGAGTFPGSSASNTIGVYLRSRSTGLHHLLERVAFGGWTGTQYPVSSFNETDDRVVALEVLPGTYDVVYYRNAGSDYVSRTSSADPYPFAMHVLASCVVLE
ncbi:MAG: hypothetical protein M5U28_47205 [Sandaracinaceae bacterium]|nr:hypothetical protein [Sandaracinaceae bacterium]